MDQLSRARTTTAENTSARSGAPGVAAILTGTMLSLFGMSWDIQWHEDVGPDTFFTLPHLFIYAGSALAGIASLVMVLRVTAATKAGRHVDTTAGGTAVGVFGKTFAAPVGYLVTGTAAAVFLFSGLWDQIWHSTYGFDATIASPPHVALLVSVAFTMMGVVITCAAAARTAWGRRGFQLSLAMLAFYVVVPLKSLSVFEGGPVNAVQLGVAFTTATALVTSAYFLRDARELIVVGLVCVALQATLWVFSPWASEAYADSVGLPLRDIVSPSPDVPSALPLALLPLVVGLAVLVATGRSRGWSPTRVAPLGGAVVGLVVALTMPFQLAAAGQEPPQALGTTLLTGLAGVAIGVLGGHLGVGFATMLRTLGSSATTTAGDR